MTKDTEILLLILAGAALYFQYKATQHPPSGNVILGSTGLCPDGTPVPFSGTCPDYTLVG